MVRSEAVEHVSIWRTSAVNLGVKICISGDDKLVLYIWVSNDKRPLF